jgi:ABC-type glycerol-3-phosphate transport system substrate-binding protein
MSARALLCLTVLGLPAAGLIVLGPRGQRDVPTGRVVVRYWEKWTGVEGAAVERIVQRFNQTVGAERGVWVDYNAVSDVDKRMLIATAGGDPPDVAGLFDHIVAQYADQGALLPLDKLVHEFGIDLETLKPVWLEIGRYDNRLYALPSTPYTIGLYYNRALFRAAGLDPDRPPRTTAELSDFAVRLTRRDAATGRLVQLGFTSSPGMLGWWHWIWPFFFDGRLWDGQRVSLDSAATRAAIDWTIRQRVAMGSVGREPPADPREANGDVLAFEAAAGVIEGAQNPFLAGRLAMVFQGPWLANWARTYAPQLDYGVAAFPSSSLQRRHAFASSDVFVIPRGSRRPREAMTFLAYMMRQDVLEELCREHGKVSPFRVPREAFLDGHPNPHIRGFDALAAWPDAFGYPKMPAWAEVWTETLALHETVLRGASDPYRKLLETQGKLERVVSEYERMAARRRGVQSASRSAP